MTILDLMRLIQRHIKLVIALPIIFAVVALAYSFFIQASYTAKMMGSAITSLRWRWMSLIKSRIVMSNSLYRTEP